MQGHIRSRKTGKAETTSARAKICCLFLVSRQRTDPFQSFGWTAQNQWDNVFIHVQKLHGSLLPLREVSRQRTSVKASSSSGGDGLGVECTECACFGCFSNDKVQVWSIFVSRSCFARAMNFSSFGPRSVQHGYIYKCGCPREAEERPNDIKRCKVDFLGYYIKQLFG